MNRGQLYIVSGPSGSGKSTVLREVFKRRDRLWFSVSATTREPRPGERDGVDYFFVTREEFDRMAANSELLEHAVYVKNCYGTPRKPVLDQMKQGIDVILDIDVQGAGQVKEKMPGAVTVFIAPPSMEELDRRLRERSTESEEKVQERLRTAAMEMERAKTYDHIVVNDRVERAAEELLAIMASKTR